jgi:hypothetical protein
MVLLVPDVTLTLLLVYTEHDHHLIATNADKLLDTTDTSSREFGEEDHSIDIIVFEELHIGAHLGDLQIWGKLVSDYSI